MACMKTIVCIVLVAIVGFVSASGQNVVTGNGRCSSDVVWSFDGQTLTITKGNEKAATAAIPDYDLQRNFAPWGKKNLPVKK